ncbi:MAG: hypothetical protein WBQ56_22885 [Candidatus Sulfotelmatobacter sp.]
MLDDDIAIRILLVFTELDVSPLNCDELAATKTGPQCHQKQRVILRANLSRRLEKLLGLTRCQRNPLDLCRLRGPRETAKARSRIHFDNARLDGLVEDPTDHAQCVSDCVARQLFLDQRVNHRLDVVALDLIEGSLPKARPEILLDHSLVSLGRGSLAFDPGIIFQPLVRVGSEGLNFFAVVQQREVTQCKLCFELAPYLLRDFSARADALRFSLAVVVHEHVPLTVPFSELYPHQLPRFRRGRRLFACCFAVAQRTFPGS